MARDSVTFVQTHGGRALRAGSRASQEWALVHARRAFTRDLRRVQPLPTEDPALAARGANELPVRQYLAWRRSWILVLLVPAVLSAVIHLIAMIAGGAEQFAAFTSFGSVVIVVLTLLPLLAIPVTAWLAVHNWSNPGLSRWLLVAGAVAAWGVPMLTALLPLHWFMEVDASLTAEAVAMQNQIVGIVMGVVWLFALLPTVLSLLPGVLRACVRIKSLLPESIVPGWFLVVAAPMYALILLLAFIAVNQMAGNFLLIAGVLLLMGAPAVYLTKTPLYVRPVLSPDERRQLDRLQIVYAAVVALGLFLLLCYLLTLEVLGRKVVGNTATGALIGEGRLAWELLKFLLNYVARSMFITAVAVDLLMLVNLSVWRNTYEFQRTPAAGAYDSLMTEFERVAAGRQAGFPVLPVEQIRKDDGSRAAS